MAELVQYYGTGRRKSAIARVFLRPGNGDFKVNGKGFDEYFVTPSQRSSAKSPLVLTESAATFNVLANVSGGGVAGQADAVKLGLARALIEFNAELRKKLKAEGMVTRDPRAKERKKYGQKGARKRFQFSKR
jgi:small subunit ribosomal protein S9